MLIAWRGETMDDTTRALLDRVELDEVMNRYAAAIDLRDWAREGGAGHRDREGQADVATSES